LAIPLNQVNGHILKCDDVVIPTYEEDGFLKAYVGESYFSKREKVDCHVSGKLVAQFRIKPFAYKEERLYVDKKRVVLSKKNQERTAREWKMLKEVYKNTANKPLFDVPFSAPLNSFITSHYGKRRIFNNMKRSQHLGNDFRAAPGVKIPSANRGKVVFAGNLFYLGNGVILDHGLGIFSTYGHLSKILVQEGEVVGKGSIVGLSGATGRVSGPHLHWGVKIQGHWVDGFTLVEASEEVSRPYE
jgi:murein DD-endopeptidase MepM/ murein hydrolase activator NlpD